MAFPFGPRSRLRRNHAEERVSAIRLRSLTQEAAADLLKPRNNGERCLAAVSSTADSGFVSLALSIARNSGTRLERRSIPHCRVIVRPDGNAQFSSSKLVGVRNP